MKEVAILRAGVRDSHRVLAGVETWLLARGYSASARTDSERQFVGSMGGPIRLSVRATATEVRFTFAPAAPGIVLPAEAELARQVDACLSNDAAAVVTSPATSSGGRCSICATVIPFGAAECPLCGMAV